MIISHKHRFIFYHIPKTGGTSLASVLRSVDPDLGMKKDGSMQANTHPTFDECYNLCKPYLDYFKFAIVRNPWSRLFSWYTFNNRWNRQSISPAGFRRFVHNAKTDLFASRTQFSYVSHQGELAVDYIGEYENLQEAFSYIRNKLQLSYIDSRLPHLNKSNFGADYRKFYSPETEAIVEEMFEIDIRAFGYFFNNG